MIQSRNPKPHQRLGSHPLSVRPGAATAIAGSHRVDVGSHRPGYVFIPPGYREAQPAPLAVLLHGAGGQAEQGLHLLEPFANAAGMIVVAPASQGRTWDLLLGGYGADVVVIDLLLRWTLERCQVAAGRFAIGGFSDGASYALSLGLDNGDRFSHIIALSPGFASPAAPLGRPRVFVSHGAADTVLPIGVCSRRIVPRLQKAGYLVQYQEFDGGHLVPTGVAQAAVGWFTGPDAMAAGSG